MQLCSALHHEGIGTIWEQLLDYQTHTQQNGYWTQRRHEQALYWLQEAIELMLHQLLFENTAMKAFYDTIKAQVLAHQLSPFRAAALVMEHFKK